MRHPSNRDAGASFRDHYLKHIALGEGCNCAESVLRTFARSPQHGDNFQSIVRALENRFAGIVRWIKKAKSDRAAQSFSDPQP